MEIPYFYFTVLPLGIIVCTLASLVFFYARREELAQWKLKRLTHAHARKRLKQKETYTKEIENLGILLRNGSVDVTTYQRLMKVLDASYQRNREEALAQLEPLLEKAMPTVKKEGRANKSEILSN